MANTCKCGSALDDISKKNCKICRDKVSLSKRRTRAKAAAVSTELELDLSAEGLAALIDELAGQGINAQLLIAQDGREGPEYEYHGLNGVDKDLIAAFKAVFGETTEASPPPSPQTEPEVFNAPLSPPTEPEPFDANAEHGMDIDVKSQAKAGGGDEGDAPLIHLLEGTKPIYPANPRDWATQEQMERLRTRDKKSSDLRLRCHLVIGGVPSILVRNKANNFVCPLCNGYKSEWGTSLKRHLKKCGQ